MIFYSGKEAKAGRRYKKAGDPTKAYDTAGRNKTTARNRETKAVREFFKSILFIFSGHVLFVVLKRYSKSYNYLPTCGIFFHQKVLRGYLAGGSSSEYRPVSDVVMHSNKKTDP